MNKNVVAVSVLLVLFFAVAASHAQLLSAEIRPFDFTNKYYEENGIYSSALVDRKNGADGQSVFDTPADPGLGDVRITATLPGYGSDGTSIFWNYYGGASTSSFTEDAAGGAAVELAYSNPMYVFPSSTLRGSDRQAAMIRMGEYYFEKNPLGIAAVFVVEYSQRIYTQMGRSVLRSLVGRNGVSLDGTPIIKTIEELKSLHTAGLVTIRQSGSEKVDRMPFAVAKVLQYPERGAIAPDAFLIYVKEADGGPLAAEAHFLSKFECHQEDGGDKLCF